MLWMILKFDSWNSLIKYNFCIKNKSVILDKFALLHFKLKKALVRCAHSCSFSTENAFEQIFQKLPIIFNALVVLLLIMFGNLNLSSWCQRVARMIKVSHLTWRGTLIIVWQRCERPYSKGTEKNHWDKVNLS